MTERDRKLMRRMEKRPLPKRPMPLIQYDGEEVLAKIGEIGFPGEVDPKSLCLEERRAAVAVLIGAGWPQVSIARRLKVSTSAITGDVRKIREAASQDCVGVTVRQVAGHLQLRLEYQYRKAMELFESVRDPKIRMQAIKLMVEISKSQAEMWIKLGFKTDDTDKRQFHQEVTAKVMIKVQQMMVVVEKHVDPGALGEVAGGWKEILRDIPLHDTLREIEGKVL